jgi:hypothetical protein
LQFASHELALDAAKVDVDPVVTLSDDAGVILASPARAVAVLSGPAAVIAETATAKMESCQTKRQRRLDRGDIRKRRGEEESRGGHRVAIAIVARARFFFRSSRSQPATFHSRHPRYTALQSLAPRSSHSALVSDPAPLPPRNHRR